LLVLVIAGVMFMVVMSLISSTNLTLDNDIGRRGYDLRLGFIGDQRAEQVINMAEEVEGVAYAEAWYARNATILRAGERLQDSAGLGAQLTGVPIGSEMQRPLIVDGRWLQPGDDRALVVSQETADENGLVVGDVIRLDLGNLGAAEWIIVGTYKVVYGGGFVTESIYAPQEAVAAGHQTGEPRLSALCRRRPRRRPAAISLELQELFEAQGMDLNLFTTATKPRSGWRWKINSTPSSPCSSASPRWSLPSAASD
jgi:putative ABC transport system permease protein